MGGFLKNLEERSSFDPSGSPVEPPTSLLWTYYFMAQHYDFQGNYARALELVDKALEHTPTLIELYTLKVRYGTLGLKNFKVLNIWLSQGSKKFVNFTT